MSGNIDLFKYLMKHKPEPEINKELNSEGLTYMDLAAKYGHFSLLKFLHFESNAG
eukprot:Pgem_evm1s17632